MSFLILPLLEQTGKLKKLKYKLDRSERKLIKLILCKIVKPTNRLIKIVSDIYFCLLQSVFLGTGNIMQYLTKEYIC